MTPIQYQARIQNIDHPGLLQVCAKSWESPITLDKGAPKVFGEWSVFHGATVAAMVTSGLGFAGPSHHMFPHSFTSKPLDKLIREGIEPEHINGKVPIMALDNLFDLDFSKVYSELAIKAVRHLKLPFDALNLDGTGFHVDGRYYSGDEVSDEDLNCIRLCNGYSRDPDRT